MELMTVFGGRSELLNAPRVEVQRALLVLLGRAEAERETAAEMDAQAQQAQSAANRASSRQY